MPFGIKLYTGKQVNFIFVKRNPIYGIYQTLIIDLIIHIGNDDKSGKVV